MVKRRNARRLFDLSYDRLVLAVGCYSQTFNTPGVREYAHFLKDVGDARSIRRRILACYEAAALPTTPVAVRKQLLNFAVVGGGPTGIEFSAELHDLIHDDLERLYPNLKGMANLTVHDVAPTVLNMFDKRLSEYAMKYFKREGIAIKTQSVVESLAPGLPPPSEGTTDQHLLKDVQTGRPGLTLRLKGQEPQGVGMVVWSTGLMANPFVARVLAQPHRFSETITRCGIDDEDNKPADWHIATQPKTGSIVTDDHLRVLLQAGSPVSSDDGRSIQATMPDVHALGDCGQIQGTSLPATAQVANQKAIWLAKRLNKGDLETENFNYRNLGTMAYLGGWRAIMQGGNGANISGWAAWVIWRGAYLVKSVSIRNKMLVPIYWVLNW